jgi:hypothetical protein
MDKVPCFDECPDLKPAPHHGSRKMGREWDRYVIREIFFGFIALRVKGFRALAVL